MLKYPFRATPDGDVQMLESDEDLIVSRIHAVVNIRPGDRALLPEFGSQIDQFAPTAGIANLNAEMLRSDIAQWATGDLSVTFAVEPEQLKSGRYRYKVSHE